jgi:acetate kinase
VVILTLNCRNQSLTCVLFDWKQRHFLGQGSLDGIGTPLATAHFGRPDGRRLSRSEPCPDHRSALDLILSLLTDPACGPLDGPERIAAIGHRVVHGGERFSRSVLIDDGVVEAIRSYEHLAPRYNRPNLAGVEAGRALLPKVPQIAVFDTSFHQSMPAHAFIYPVPYSWYQKLGVRRYGFHGTSHLYLAKRASALLGKAPGKCNLITVHVDRGISLCAIKNGVSIDTSMGMTPIEGALMESRCGDIDPGIPSFLMDKEGLSPSEMTEILNQRSGLFGITGTAVSRYSVLEQAAQGDACCILAVEMEAYRLKKYIGGYLAAVGRPDAIVFTSGHGPLEAGVRERVLDTLGSLGIRLDRVRNRAPETVDQEVLVSAEGSSVRVYVVPTHEELVFAADTAAILQGTFADHLDYDYPFAHADFPAYPTLWRPVEK